MSKIAGMSGKGEYLQMMKRLMVCVLLLALITLQGCQRTEINNAKEVSGELSTREDSQNQETTDGEVLESDGAEGSAETGLLREEPENVLESWVGLYRYWLVIPDDIQEDRSYFVGFTIKIYEEEGEYYADITGRGDLMCSEVLARIEGDENAIDFLFVETLPLDTYYDWSGFEDYEKNDLLLSFIRDGDTMQTQWGMLETETFYFADREDEIVGEYFEKIAINEETNGDLSSWIGVYQYEESFPTASEEEDTITYTVNIYEENGVYYADIAGRGQQLYSESLTYIQGDENAIDFFFMETLPEDARFWRDERYDLNSLLLSFSQKDGEIQTSWELLRREHPAFADNEEEITGKYFEKIDTNNNGREDDERNIDGEVLKSDLSSWLGNYFYFEAVPHNTNEGFYMCVGFEMEIYEQEGTYYANISGDGRMLCSRTLARIEGDENSIDILFVETLPGDTAYGSYESFDKDECLFSLSHKEDIIQTSWGALQIESLFFSDRKDEIIGEYFEKEIIPEEARELLEYLFDYLYEDQSNMVEIKLYETADELYYKWKSIEKSGELSNSHVLAYMSSSEDGEYHGYTIYSLIPYKGIDGEDGCYKYYGGYWQVNSNTKEIIPVAKECLDYMFDYLYQDQSNMIDIELYETEDRLYYKWKTKSQTGEISDPWVLEYSYTTNDGLYHEYAVYGEIWESRHDDGREYKVHIRDSYGNFWLVNSDTKEIIPWKIYNYEAEDDADYVTWNEKYTEITSFYAENEE